MSDIFGELLNFPQEKGPEVRLRVFGDEHYARYEDIDGYTMVYDKARGLFCYAALAGNRFVSTGVPLDQPPPPTVVRHLRESLAVKQAKAEEQRLLHHPPGVTGHEEVVRTFGPNQGFSAAGGCRLGACGG
jgi:hypothetical protein